METALVRTRVIGRGPLDTGAAHGVLYLEDGETDDSLVNDAWRALEDGLEDRPKATFGSTGPSVGPAYWGDGQPSPSVVWHAQAAGVLLEYNFSPSTQCVQRHLRVLRERLSDSLAASPEAEPESEWRLRTRHVAWVLACLSEHAGSLSIQEGLPPEIEKAGHELVELVTRCFRLLGAIDGEGAAEWVGRRRHERFWSEHWGARRTNLLNTIYASLAMFRALRHGLIEDTPNRAQRWALAETAVTPALELLKLVRLESTPNGPRARLDGEWHEPWAQGELPPGVVGLLSLTFQEYGNLMVATAPHQSDQAEQGQRVLMLSRRLAHDLISRSDTWTSAVDAFGYTGAEGDWWYVNSYSVCARAVLESRAVPPTHQVVLDAFATINALARSGERGGHAFTTWADPTRRELGATVSDIARTTWHATTAISDRLAREDLPATPGSIHAAAMAFASLRRALGGADPRTTLFGRPPAKLPESPFSAMVAGREHDARNEIHLTTPDGYTETLVISEGAVQMLRAVKQLETEGKSTTDTEVGKRVRRISPTARAPFKAEGVRGAISDVNRRIGVELVHRDGSKGSRLTGAFTWGAESPPT